MSAVAAAANSYTQLVSVARVVIVAVYATLPPSVIVVEQWWSSRLHSGVVGVETRQKRKDGNTTLRRCVEITHSITHTKQQPNTAHTSRHDATHTGLLLINVFEKCMLGGFPNGFPVAGS